MSTILFIDFAQSAHIAANRHGAMRIKSMHDKPESPAGSDPCLYWRQIFC
ncbi:hypothetical protein [Burkholderia ubonensis]|nr:hypothetical protein [Burkholderia ubonensis]